MHKKHISNNCKVTQNLYKFSQIEKISFCSWWVILEFFYMAIQYTILYYRLKWIKEVPAWIYIVYVQHNILTMNGIVFIESIRITSMLPAGCGEICDDFPVGTVEIVYSDFGYSNQQ